MSDKQLVLEAIERLPDSATLVQIRDRVDFLAALQQGEKSLAEGKGIPHDEVKKRFLARTKSWRSKSSGRPKRSATSPT